MPSIKVNLDAVADGSGGEGNSIRMDAFRRVLLKLVQPAAKTDESDDHRSRRPSTLDVIPHRRHDAILVSARRGDGKTTFLTDVLAVVQKTQGDGNALKAELGAEYPDKACSLYSLGIIDPTLIENKQNIVIIIIEKIKSAVDRHYEVARPDAEKPYEDFKQKLHELASGLTLLDGIGEDAAYGKDWADPDYILEAGLDRAKAAGAFERTFHGYVAKACAFIGRDAFLLAIDDVDTWFERGWPVLEAIRKYLATPRLKILMAGDLNLYSLLVRQRQWKQITKEFVDIEAQASGGNARRRHIERMVDTLQDQYLIKIAPPENRIDLKPLLSYAQDPGIELYAGKSGAPGLPESDFAQTYAKRLFAMASREDASAIRETLLRIPLRSSLQVLAGAWGLKADPTANDGGARQRALDALRYVASTWMMSLDLDANAVRDAGPNRIFGVLATWMSERNLWSTMPRFQPDGHDDGRNLVIIFLAALLVENFEKHPHIMIDYWIRICTIREYFDSHMVEEVDAKPLMNHLKVGTNEKTLQFASRLVSWEVGGAGAGSRQLSRGTRLTGASVPATRLREPGSVQYELYGISGTSSQKEVFCRTFDDLEKNDFDQLLNAIATPLKGFHTQLIAADWRYRPTSGSRIGITGTLANSLESLRKQLDPDAATVMALGAMHVTSAQQSENGVYSFLRILAVVGELIELGRSGDATEDVIGELLARLAQVRSYPAPASAPTDPQEIDNLGEEDDATWTSANDMVEDQEPLARVLALWLSSFEADIERMALAPLTLARIWTRFTYASTSIRGKLRHLKTRYLGVLMHRTIIAFLHAVGVESLRASGATIEAKMIDNPIESSEPFVSLLNKLEDLKSEDGKVPTTMLWFEFLFSCPIWGYFLARSDENIAPTGSRSLGTEKVYEYYNKRMESHMGINGSLFVNLHHPEDASKTATFESLYFPLNSVQLQGQRSNQAAAKSSPVAQTLEILGAETEAPTPQPRPQRSSGRGRAARAE